VTLSKHLFVSYYKFHYRVKCTVRRQYQDVTAGRGRETGKCRRRNNILGQSIPDPS